MFRTPAVVSPWTVLLGQLRSVLVVLLAIGAAVSVATGDLPDAGAILAVLVLNVTIGFVTELRAHRAMEALRGLEVLRARVVRDGSSRTVDAREVVPGDIILLESGQQVPADARLLEATELRTVESALSGEPGSVTKSESAKVPIDAPTADRRTMVFKTTNVVTGSGRAVVVATGMATEVGRIGELVGSVVKTATPLEQRLDALGRRLAAVAVAVAVLIAAVGAWQGMSLADLLQNAIALAVAAVPEALPVVGTIAMAVGVRRMARCQALVRHLPVVEALGSASVICTDKTGTLTAGQMTATVVRLAEREVMVTGAGLLPEGDFSVDGTPFDPAADQTFMLALRVGALANAGELHHRDGDWHPVGDPTDIAFLVLARKAGLDRNQLVTEWPETGHLPFSSERMLMATFHRRDGRVTTCVKGAPRRVLERCDRIATAEGVRQLHPGELEELLGSGRALADRGLRVLALAMRENDHVDSGLSGLTWVAFVGLSDPPAAGVPETIRAFREAGIRTVMITGDHRLTAASIGKQLGLLGPGDQVLEGREVDRMTDEELDAAVRRTGAFGRTSPEAKLRIVAALQRGGETVAMLGDGVNDAAALRKADVGVAMGGRGTDLAKDAADVVLQDDRFPTVAIAIEEGRVILANVRKFVLYLFSCNLAEILVLLGAGLAGHPSLIPPLQILWLNILTDTFPALALALEPGEASVMRRPPDPRGALLPAPLLWRAVGYAMLITLVTLAAFAWDLRRADAAHASTVAFMTLGFAQIFHLGNARSDGPVIALPRVLGNRYALGAALLATLLQILAGVLPPLGRVLHVTPLSLTEWVVVGCTGLIPAVVGQAIKAVRSSTLPTVHRGEGIFSGPS